MLVCLGESALISIGLEVGDHPSKEVSVSPTIKGLDRDRSGEDSERRKRQNQTNKKDVSRRPLTCFEFGK